jgi:hypothetical protein
MGAAEIERLKPGRTTLFFNPVNGLIPFRPDYPNSKLMIR